MKTACLEDGDEFKMYFKADGNRLDMYSEEHPDEDRDQHMDRQ